MLTKRLISSDPMITRQRALTISLAAVVIVYILWNVDILSPIAYPFRLFVTYVHEAGHSLMAMATGGRVLGFTVSSDGSGLAVTAGGSRPLILMAGYVGAALFGAGLFYILNTLRHARTISVVLGAGLILFTLLYARPDDSGLPIALLVGLASGAALIGLGWKVRAEWNLLVLYILSLMTALNAVLDLFSLTRITRVTGAMCDSGRTLNDAAAFTCDVTPAIPPVVWAFLWAGLAVAMMAASVYYSLLRPMLKSADQEIERRKVL